MIASSELVEVITKVSSQFVVLLFLIEGAPLGFLIGGG